RPWALPRDGVSLIISQMRQWHSDTLSFTRNCCPVRDSMTPPPLMHGFLRAQFTYLFRTFPLRRSWRHKLWILAEAAQLVARYNWLLISLRFGSSSGAIQGKKCAIVLL